MDSDPIGLFGTLTLQKKEIGVSPGDRFYMFSDGLIESTPGGGRRQGLAKLVDACVRQRFLPLAEGVEGIVRDICGSAAAPEDDLLLLAVDALPAREPRRL
jgi:sigma-B regulation protein RsbU (phosphoserine phosphatase)